MAPVDLINELTQTRPKVVNDNTLEDKARYAVSRFFSRMAKGGVTKESKSMREILRSKRKAKRFTNTVTFLVPQNQPEELNPKFIEKSRQRKAIMLLDKKIARTKNKSARTRYINRLLKMKYQYFNLSETVECSDKFVKIVDYEFLPKVKVQESCPYSKTSDKSGMGIYKNQPELSESGGRQEQVTFKEEDNADVLKQESGSFEETVEQNCENIEESALSSSNKKPSNPRQNVKKVRFMLNFGESDGTNVITVAPEAFHTLEEKPSLSENLGTELSPQPTATDLDKIASGKNCSSLPLKHFRKISQRAYTKSAKAENQTMYVKRKNFSAPQKGKHSARLATQRNQQQIAPDISS